MNLYEEDLHHLGWSTFEEEGRLSMTILRKNQVELIMLREILAKKNQKILSVSDHSDDEIMVRTNKPWKEYSLLDDPMYEEDED